MTESTGTAGEIRSFVRRTQAKALLLGGALGLLIIFLWRPAIGIGYIFGSLLSIVNFQLMTVDVFGMVDKSPKSAKKFIMLRYSLRYAILFISLALIATRTNFNIIAVFAGMLSIQAVLVGERVFMQALNGIKRKG